MDPNFGGWAFHRALIWQMACLAKTKGQETKQTQIGKHVFEIPMNEAFSRNAAIIEAWRPSLLAKSLAYVHNGKNSDSTAAAAAFR